MEIRKWNRSWNIYCT